MLLPPSFELHLIVILWQCRSALYPAHRSTSQLVNRSHACAVLQRTAVCQSSCTDLTLASSRASCRKQDRRRAKYELLCTERTLRTSAADLDCIQCAPSRPVLRVWARKTLHIRHMHAHRAASYTGAKCRVCSGGAWHEMQDAGLLLAICQRSMALPALH